MLDIDLIGYLAGITVAISLTPQVLKAWRTKSTRDISVTWTLIYIFGLFLWIVYGFGISSYPVIFTITIEALLAFSLLVLKLKYG
ncbi:hypothetical protein GF412_02055 [Candidatus Micrarchaeota archaeon]|nr:hypothetical protein [Candidatus Micrarchaeota archaeon]MBD3417745.1 hypothetical protein [Candidatus Micrarchaeota archaeon]